MKRKSSAARSQSASAEPTISASRWQTVPVTICRTGAPLRARRSASRSVARSPTSAATRQWACNAVRVACKKVVFPAPGLDTRLTANRFAASNRCRRPWASRSFFLRIPCRTSTILDCIFWNLRNLQGSQLELATAQHLGRWSVAHRATKVLQARQLPLLTATRAIHGDGDLFDLEPGALDGRAGRGEIEGELQRFANDARERPEPQVERLDPHVALGLCLFARRLDEAHRDRQLVHEGQDTPEPQHRLAFCLLEIFPVVGGMR